MIAGGAFSDVQFRRFFSGVFFAVQAIWIQRVTLAWLAWERTGSAEFVGLVAGLSLAPTLVAGPLFGVLADRIDIRRGAFATNGGMALVLAALAIALPVAGPLALAAAALAIGTISAAHHPIRMSLGPRLVPTDMVQHVVAVTALNFNLARLAAPVVAGWVIAGFGAAVALWLAVLCYLPMLLVLPGLRPRDLPSRDRAPFLTEMRAGIRFAARAPLIRTALLITLVFTTPVRGALEVLAVLADGAFGRGAAGLGMLTAAAGAGALGAAFLKAAGAGAAGARIPPVVYAVVLVGFAAVMGMGLSRSWEVTLAMTALAGFAATWCGVSLQAAIQTDLPDAYRGRVMSLWVVVGFGTVAIGAVVIGLLAERLGIGPALVWAGAGGLPLLGGIVAWAARR